ncbi:MAG TPA: cell division protein SepF [Xenococcaceae cyanobacterium]
MFESIKNFFRVDDGDFDDEDFEIVEAPKREENTSPSATTQYNSGNTPYSIYHQPKSNQGGKTVNNVVGMPGLPNSDAEVSVITPRSFDEMPEVIRALRDRKSVILNLNMMEPELAQRAVDFVSGGTYAIDGQFQRVGETIFLFTPSCVKVNIHLDVIDDLTSSSNPRVNRPTANEIDYWQEQSAVGQ